LFFSVIPTVNSEVAKFVHFIRQQSLLFSPTFNHTRAGGLTSFHLALRQAAVTVRPAFSSRAEDFYFDQINEAP
jgi:hypothetical protein